MIAYIFPGQGSQQKGMGGTIFDEFIDLTVQADEILGYSIKELCMEDPEDKLGQTQYTQPALYVVNALSYLKKIKDTGIKPDYVAGHSLGEYNALFAAEAFDFATGLKLVKKRGELMSQVTGGGMAAVIGLSEEKVKEVIERNNLQSIDVANLNTLSQIVISGLKKDIIKAKPYFEESEAMSYVVLKVSGAFHSRHMIESSKSFEEYLEGFTFSDIKIPVISNMYARPYKNSQIKKNLIEQISGSVKWTETIRYLMGKGEVQIEQIGPGRVLTGMVSSIRREATPLIVTDEEDNKEEQGDIGQAVCESTGICVCKELEEVDCGINREEEIKLSSEVSISEKEHVFTAERLGCQEFKKDYGLKYAYLAGAMHNGITSKEMVVKMGKSGFMCFFGTSGLNLAQIEASIKYIKKELKNEQPYGMNLLYNIRDTEAEEKIVDLFLQYEVRNIEASAFISVTPALARLRLKGVKRNAQGHVVTKNKIVGKVSRPEIAEAFLSPVPERIIEKLLSEGKITHEEAELSKEIPVVDDLCVAADSGGHTNYGAAFVLIPAMLKLRDEMMDKFKYMKKVRVGAAGGIGTPEAAVAAFVMGADFIMTGSINQCTVEGGTSDSVKDLLQQINVQDTEYAPEGDMFEIGTRVQVLKKGVFFPARANKLYELYRQYNSLDDIDEKTRNHIQEKYFRRSFEQVYQEIKSSYSLKEIDKADQNPKYKMALIFQWYFNNSIRLALDGVEDVKVDYQVYCGPSLGSFNQWVKGTELESWKNRNVDEIAIKIMTETANLLVCRMNSIFDKKYIM